MEWQEAESDRETQRQDGNLIYRALKFVLFVNWIGALPVLVLFVERHRSLKQI